MSDARGDLVRVTVGHFDQLIYVQFCGLRVVGAIPVKFFKDYTLELF